MMSVQKIEVFRAEIISYKITKKGPTIFAYTFLFQGKRA